MNAYRNLPRRSNRALAALLALCLPTATAWAACPKLLMFDGTDFRKQTNAEQAQYWGRTVGVQGFFVNHVMGDWTIDVGTDPGSRLWNALHEFQSLYSRYGVGDNFIKVALYKGHDWQDPSQRQVVAENFAHAAALAKYAGFKGVALDLEPYVPTWDGTGGSPELARAVQEQGREIGEAMHDAYPDMTLIVIKDALHENYPHATLEQLASAMSRPPGPAVHFWHGGYSLAIPFLRGLLSIDWKQVVIATEDTYKTPDITAPVRQTQQNYLAFIGRGDAAQGNLSVAPGLWPLGLSYQDKSARNSPSEFEQHLKDAYGAATQYVWIYGYGSAWQSDGPYGAGPVSPDFPQYVAAIHRVRATCDANGP